MTPRLARANVIGSQISLCGKAAALEFMERSIDSGSGGYVCFTNAHAVIEGQRNESFRSITNSSLLSLADGMPVFWAANWSSLGARRVPGPDFFLYALSRRPRRRHFLYGSSAENLEKLRINLRRRFPDAIVCGAIAPPFGPITEETKREHIRMIREARAEFVWVGLGAPKQEHWMAEVAAELRPAVLLGVGAAFDFHSGRVRRAPALLRRYGLEWLYRLAQEPERLWRRYFVTNSLFLWYLAKDRLHRVRAEIR